MKRLLKLIIGISFIVIGSSVQYIALIGNQVNSDVVSNILIGIGFDMIGFIYARDYLKK